MPPDPRPTAAALARRAPDLAAALAARGWALPAAVDRVADATRARTHLSWAPRYGWAEVLAEYDRESPEVLPPLPPERAVRRHRRAATSSSAPL